MTTRHPIGLRMGRYPREMAARVFGASATLSGMCLTVIGLLHIQFALRDIDTPADDLLVGNALLYMVACLLSYVALRRPAHVAASLAWLVDACFMTALAMTTGIGAVIAWTLFQ